MSLALDSNLSSKNLSIRTCILSTLDQRLEQLPPPHTHTRFSGKQQEDYIQQQRSSELAIAEDEGEREAQAILKSRVLPGERLSGASKEGSTQETGRKGCQEGDRLDLAPI